VRASTQNSANMVAAASDIRPSVNAFCTQSSYTARSEETTVLLCKKTVCF
jgi:hypothetical protein